MTSQLSQDQVLHTTPLLIASQGGHVEAVLELSLAALTWKLFFRGSPFSVGEPVTDYKRLGM